MSLKVRRAESCEDTAKANSVAGLLFCAVCDGEGRGVLHLRTVQRAQLKIGVTGPETRGIVLREYGYAFRTAETFHLFLNPPALCQLEKLPNWDGVAIRLT